MKEDAKRVALEAAAAQTHTLEELAAQTAEHIARRDGYLLKAKAAGATWTEMQAAADLTPAGLRKVFQRSGILERP